MVHGGDLLQAEGAGEEVASEFDLRVGEWRAVQEFVEGVAAEGVDV